MEFKKRKRPQGVISTPPSRATDSSATELEGHEEGEEDHSVSEALEDLIALRKLKRAAAGIDLERLNAGDKKKRKRGAIEDGPSELITSNGMVEGTKGGLTKAGDRLGETKNSIIKTNNFTGQTNAVDVDKHMMAYIEEELRKRKGASTDSEPREQGPFDPRDALYNVGEKYKSEKKQVQEGNITLSSAMLTAIPEVDLGIDERLKNIEDTEKAKRLLFEERSNQKTEEEEGEGQFASDRFYKARRIPESDVDALAKARKEAALEALEEKEKEKEHKRKKEPLISAGRRELATDDQVMSRFKNRQQGKK